MNVLTSRFLDRVKSLNYRLFGIPPYSVGLTPDATAQAAGDLIRDRLLRPAPCMICRFGRSEMTAISRYLDVTAPGSFLSKSVAYIGHTMGRFWWDEEIRVEMLNQSGFFPGTDESLERFGARMLDDMRFIDVLGTWLPEEARIADRFRDAAIVPLVDLEPYFHERPWSSTLEGRRVLVIHPFDATIRSQYDRREALFPGRNVLPDFELITFRSVQSVVGTPVAYPTWFDALDWMCEQIADIDFDIAIIGAGAYGMPLAAHVKRLGKKAIHLGGPTQILFGIRGTRWDDRPPFRRLFNEAWVRPAPSEVPANYRVLEQGAYW